MIYKVVLTYPTKKELDKLDPVAKKAVREKIEYLLLNPLKNARKLHDSKIGEYRWRVGNYRVVFDVEKDLITIIKIAHRREVYNDN